VQFGNDLDYVRLLQFYSSTATPEARLVLARIDPLGIVLVADMEGESWNENNAHFKLPIGEWVCVEFEKYVDESDGYIGAVLPGVCRITSDRLDEGSITKFRLGAIDQTGDLRGHVYFDAILVDEDRLWDDRGAYNGALSGGSLLFLKSGFAFLDAGEVEHVSLIDGGSGDCRVRIYDTEDPTMLPLGALRENLATLAANATEPSRVSSRDTIHN
jgi:hypothetical protein